MPLRHSWLFSRCINSDNRRLRFVPHTSGKREPCGFKKGGGAPSPSSDRPGGTSIAVRLLIGSVLPGTVLESNHGKKIPHLIDCPGGKRRRRAGAVAGLRTATGGAGTRLGYERRAGAEEHRGRSEKTVIDLDTLDAAAAL